MPSTTGGEPGQRQWTFAEKWILQEALNLFVAQEIYKQRMAQYNTPLSPPLSPSNPSEFILTPLQKLITNRVEEETVQNLGWANWGYISSVLRDHLSGPPDCPPDGGLNIRARILLRTVIYVVIQETFGVPKCQI